MQNKEDFIYDLIFSRNLDYKINLANYVDDIYLYEEFIDEIKSILKSAKVKVIKSDVKLDSKTAIWHLKVNK